MGLRVEGRVSVEVCLAIVMIVGTASAADKRPAARTSSADVDEGPSRKESGLRVGALAGVGFPRPLTIEGVVGIARALAIGGE